MNDLVDRYCQENNIVMEHSIWQNLKPRKCKKERSEDWKFRKYCFLDVCTKVSYEEFKEILEWKRKFLDVQLIEQCDMEKVYFLVITKKT